MNAKDHKHHMVGGQPVELRQVIGEYTNEISPKQQFMAVVEYLCANRSYSTVDEIFADLAPRMPSVTKAVINKALDALAETGVIEVLRLDNSKAVDAAPAPHAHFICSQCGHMEEVPMAFDISSALMLPNGARVEDTQIMCLGVCPCCNSPKGVN